MRATFLLILISVCTISLKSNGQKPEADFKIVGYFGVNAAMEADTSSFPFNKLTHINLAFVNPDASGNFNRNFDALVPFIKAAHSHDVKVLYSIGGGASPEEYHDLLKQNKARQGLIKNLVTKVLQYNVDGVDVDLELGYVFGPNGMAISRSFPRENPAIPGTDPNYAIFIKELAQALRSHNKLITVALPSRPADVVTQEVISQFDLIYIMSYDHTGQSRPDRPGHHSTYVDAMDDLDYYRFTLMVPKEKLVLGVPFYGRGFGPGLSDPVIAYMKYSDIVSTYAGAEWADHWHLPNGYIMYYSGIPSIKNKTKLAKKEAAGIMIWELGYDASGRKSLLNAINEAVRDKLNTY
jgi:GH18 family chitinase